MLDPKDGGMASRKMWFAAATGLLIVGCWLLTGFWIPLATTFEPLLGGLLGVLGIYATGNIANKYVVAKSLPGVSFQGETGQPPPPPPPGGPPPAAPVQPAPVKPAVPPAPPAKEEEGS